MEIEQVVDRESLEAYLKDLPIEVSRAIAMRSALRITPLQMRLLDIKDKKERQPNWLSAGLRAMLISSVVCLASDTTTIHASTVSARFAQATAQTIRTLKSPTSTDAKLKAIALAALSASEHSAMASANVIDLVDLSEHVLLSD